MRKTHDFFDHMLTHCLRILESASGSILLLDKQHNGFIVTAAQGARSAFLVGTRVSADKGVVGHVAGKREALMVSDVRQDHALKASFRAAEYQSHSFLSVPLQSDGRFLGIINITEKKNGQAFSEKDLAYVTAVAAALAKTTETLLHCEHLERQLESFKNSTAVTKVTSAIAHDLNSPLDGCLRFAQLALRQAPEASVLKQHIGYIYDGLRRMSALVTAMLDFSFAGDRNYSPICRDAVDINAVISQEVDFLREQAAAANISLHCILAQGLPLLRDCGLSRVVTNLLQNALEAVQQNGQITFHTYRDGQQVCIAITDSGQGINPAEREKIFEPFYTTKFHGKGLGLSIVREIIACYNGAIRVEDNEPHGTRIRLWIPCGE